MEPGRAPVEREGVPPRVEEHTAFEGRSRESGQRRQTIEVPGPDGGGSLDLDADDTSIGPFQYDVYLTLALVPEVAEADLLIGPLRVLGQFR